MLILNRNTFVSWYYAIVFKLRNGAESRISHNPIPRDIGVTPTPYGLFHKSDFILNDNGKLFYMPWFL